MFFYQQKEPKKKIFAAGFLGAIVGMVAGILVAPKSGKETRKQLRKWSDDMQDDIQDRVKTVSDMTREKYEHTVDAVAEKYKKMQTIKENEVSDLSAELKSRWEKIKDQWEK